MSSSRRLDISSLLCSASAPQPVSSDPSRPRPPLVSSLFPVPRDALSPTLSPVSSYSNERYPSPLLLYKDPPLSQLHRPFSPSPDPHSRPLPNPSPTSPSNPSYSGLDALVHVASEEHRRLSAGSEPNEDPRVATSPRHLLDLVPPHHFSQPRGYVRHTDPAPLIHPYRKSPPVDDARPHKRRRRSGSGSGMEQDRAYFTTSEDERDSYNSKATAIQRLIHHPLPEHDHRFPSSNTDIRPPPAFLSGPGLRGPGVTEYPITSPVADQRRSDAHSVSITPLDVPKKEISREDGEDISNRCPSKDRDKVPEGTHTHKRQEPDAHEWLLEHYAPSSPPAPKQSQSLEPVQDGTSVKVQTSTPEAATALEHESPPADAARDVLDDAAKSDIDIEGISEHSSYVGQDGIMDVDVEDELLSLLDDRPSHPPTKNPVTYRRKLTSLPTQTTAPVTDTRRFGTPSVSTPVQERGSMPPPTTTRDSGDNMTSTATTKKKKKKDGLSKTVPKLKPPPKPRAKTTVKPKNKNLIDGSSAVSKGASLASRKKDIPGSASRSRSTSVMPSTGADVDVNVDLGKDAEEGEGKADEDDKLYCVCRTQYDEDRVMIACDRCDEWYHTQCVELPDLEIDLVDQFICPPCIASNSHLFLRTTYKKRCLFGLKHPDPSSPDACHKPSRGAFSKYCSDECGVKYLQSRIDSWSKKGGKKEKLWESVKGAQKREGVVTCIEETDGEVKMEVDGAVDVPKLEAKVQRDVERLNVQLTGVVQQREQLKKEMEVILWREKLTELATRRSEKVDQCGWDQRLCFGDEEWADFGAGVLESYDEGGDAVHVASPTEGDGEWWCTGKKKCDRHAGWQKLRTAEVLFEKEMKDSALSKLTIREREIRKRIEDILDPQSRHVNDTLPKSPLKSSNADSVVNGITKSKTNGEGKKGKKRKASAL